MPSRITSPQGRSSTVPSEGRLKVFISSTMAELRDVREVLSKALDDRGIYAWFYEKHAGARPEGVEQTSLVEIETADVYVGLFWERYGEVTVKEFRHARATGKPFFIYIRDKNKQREKQLEDFLEAEIYSLTKGVTYDYFESALSLGQRVAEDIVAWLVRRHREMTAEIREAHVSERQRARLQAEVDRLRRVSRDPLPGGTAVDYLAQQMTAWFKALGYGFERHSARAGDYFEWVIDVPARRKYDRILVRGIEGVAELSDVAALRGAVNKHKADEGWLVAAVRKSQAACNELSKEENRNLFCYTFDELLDERADFTGYLNWLETEVRTRGIDRMYVPLACTRDELDPVSKTKIGESVYDEKNGWIEGYIDRWLDDPSKEHISVLGEFGTGKTWFALHYAWTLLHRYREAKERGVERPRIPLVIPLRDYAKAVSIESLFSEFFFRKHEIPLPGYSAFEQLNRMGKILLIFDGFDEMAAKVDRQQMVNNFWELGRAVVPGAKVILTCRTEHFPEAQEGRKLLSSELQASTAALTGQPPQFEVLELRKLNPEQIRRVLSLRADAATVRAVTYNAELVDLATRPLMLELILEALPSIEAGKPIDLSRVYLYAVQRKMERDIKAQRTFTSLADKLCFMCEVSWEMLSTNRMSLNYRLFPERLTRLFGPLVSEQKEMDHWHYDMMGQTMLVRNAEGDYTPAHRSLLEFFVAYKFAAELGVLAPDFAALAQAQSSVAEGARPVDHTWSAYFQRKAGRSGSIVQVARLRRFAAEGMEGLAQTVGREKFSEALLDFLENMVARNDAGVVERLLDLIRGTRGYGADSVGYVGGNVATLLRRLGVGFRGASLKGTVLTGADLHGVDLTKADFTAGVLRETNFWSTRLVDTNLSKADLTGVELGERYWIRALRLIPETGRVLVAGGNSPKPARGESPSFFALLDLNKGCQVYNFMPGTEIVWALCLHPDGRRGAMGGDDGKIWVFDTGSGKIVGSLPGLGGRIGALEFTPDGRRLICADDGIRIWDFDTLREVHSWAYPESHGVVSLAISPDGTVMNVAYYNREYDVVLNPITGVEVGKAAYKPQSFHCVRSASFHPLAPILAIADDRTIRLWDLGKHRELRIISYRRDAHPQITRVAFSPDGSKIAASAYDRTVRVWDTVGGEEVTCLRGHGHYVYDLCWTPDGRNIVSGSSDATVRLWDVNPSGRSFGQCLAVAAVELPCQGLRLSGAVGLHATAPNGGGTLSAWLQGRGARLQARTRESAEKVGGRGSTTRHTAPQRKISPDLKNRSSHADWKGHTRSHPKR